ncbi:MAG: L-threonylcarbamoyladenylate synthase [Saprospiraceae bacterium]|nr:L-threonylcarbamoyladenylate synthase [Saprospiraceae bacterium]
MLFKIHADNPSDRKIRQVCDILEDGGVMIFPTDTIYALAAALDQKRAFERICRIKDIHPRKAAFSMIVRDLSHASPYLAQISTPHYRMLRRNLPGPFTFVLPGGHALPSHVRAGRKTIGLRIPDHPVSLAIIDMLGQPLITTSVRSDDNLLEYFTDPEEIYAAYKGQIDCMIDSGSGTFEPSTVVDMTTDPVTIVRQGRGELEE